MSDWRHPQERADLVERVIAAEKRTRLLEQDLRARVVAEEKHLAGAPDAVALMERIRELEGIIQRMNDRIARRRTA